MTTAIPAKGRPKEFGFTVFSHLMNPYGAGYVLDFETYARFLAEELETVKHKSKSKLVTHTRSVDGRRRKPDLRSIEAWAVDCDGEGSATRPEALLDDLRAADVSFVYQERDGRPDGKPLKYHLILPLAEPHFWEDGEGAEAACAEWTDRLRALRGWLDARTGNVHDKAMDRINQGLRPYHRRPEDANTVVVQIEHFGENAIDLGTLLAEIGYAPSNTARVRKRGVDAGALKAFGHLIKAEAPARLGGWYIECPADHGEDTVSKTWLRPDGTVTCLAARCRGQPQAYFTALLEGEAKAALVDERLEEASRRLARGAVAVRVPLSSASGAIAHALSVADPLETNGHVVRVTPGAGKTYAAARFLEGYAAGEDGDGGRTAVLAFPTNALLREVARTVEGEFQVRTGVLGVVNEDGTPACLKWREATEVQNAGGNVHKLMCARCEFKEDCPARALSNSGAGSLVLTNHALLPSVVRDLRGRGRLPLVVWDESPTVADAKLLTWSDLYVLRARLLTDATPPSAADVLDALSRYPVWGEAETAARLFLCDFVLGLRPRDGSGIVTIDLPSAVRAWGATPSARARVRSLRSRLGLPVSGPSAALSLEEVREVVAVAVGGGGADTPYDQLPRRERAAFAEAWRVGGLLDAVLAEGARVRAGAGGVEVTSLTENGRVWRETGGVILDATASRSLLTAAKAGPVSVTDVAVQDAPGVKRTWVLSEGLSRTAFRTGAGGGPLKAVVTDLLSQIADTDRVVVFVYKDILEHEELKRLGPSVSLAYYGNVRGYNNYYREGYTHFVTVGDPVSNIGALDSVASFLGSDPDALAAEGAAGELAQAHGRARDVRPGPTRTHIHYGKQVPLGWDTATASVRVLGGGAGGVAAGM